MYRDVYHAGSLLGTEREVRITTVIWRCTWQNKGERGGCISWIIYGYVSIYAYLYIYIYKYMIYNVTPYIAYSL